MKRQPESVTATPGMNLQTTGPLNPNPPKEGLGDSP